jgi:hypothetical protein
VLITNNLKAILNEVSHSHQGKIDGRSDLTKKLEKVGPFECDELEKQCRVSSKCFPTTVSALYTMTKEKFKSVSRNIEGGGLMAEVLCTGRRVAMTVALS